MSQFSWTVRFDVVADWVADGFTISDARALDMLTDQLTHAQRHEVHAVVLDTPPVDSVLEAQGYIKGHAGTPAARRELMAEVTESGALRKSIEDAVKLLDSVAFVREEGDETATVLANLRISLDVLRADQPEMQG